MRFLCARLTVSVRRHAVGLTHAAAWSAPNDASCRLRLAIAAAAADPWAIGYRSQVTNVAYRAVYLWHRIFHSNFHFRWFSAAFWWRRVASVTPFWANDFDTVTPMQDTHHVWHRLPTNGTPHHRTSVLAFKCAQSLDFSLFTSLLTSFTVL